MRRSLSRNSISPLKNTKSDTKILARRGNLLKRKVSKLKRVLRGTSTLDDIGENIPALLRVNENTETYKGIHAFLSKALKTFWSRAGTFSLDSKPQTKKEIKSFFFNLIASLRKQYILLEKAPNNDSLINFLLNVLPKVSEELVLARTRLDQMKKLKFKAEAFRIEMKRVLTRNELKQCIMLYDNLLLSYGKILQHFDNYPFSIRIFKTIKRFSILPEQKPNLMNTFYSLAESFAALDKHKIAMLYCKRCLELSYFLQDKSMEMRVYDLIGRQFFHLGNLEKARYFHERMAGLLLEPLDSPIRTLFLRSLAAREKRIKLPFKHQLDYFGAKHLALSKIDKTNEHELYYSSSDDEEVPISIAIDELRPKRVKREASKLKTINERTRAKILFEKIKTQSQKNWFKSAEEQKQYEKRNRLSTKKGYENEDDFLPRVSFMDKDKFNQGRMLQHKSPNRSYSAFFFPGTKKKLKFRSENTNSLSSIPLSFQAKSIVKILEELIFKMSSLKFYSESFEIYLRDLKEKEFQKKNFSSDYGRQNSFFGLEKLSCRRSLIYRRNVRLDPGYKKPLSKKREPVLVKSLLEGVDKKKKNIFRKR